MDMTLFSHGAKCCTNALNAMMTNEEIMVRHGNTTNKIG
jgi:hypothetical protein